MAIHTQVSGLPERSADAPQRLKLTQKGTMLKWAAGLICTLVSTLAIAQISPPQHESRFHHLFTQHRENDNLPERFEELKCALVVIRTPVSTGTGFFISQSGEVATAAHVLGEKRFDLNSDQTVHVTLQHPTTIEVQTTSRTITLNLPSALEINGDQWLVDLAVLRTSIPTPCWLSVADDKRVRTGEHIVSMGFPGLAFGSLSFYTGIVSARLKIDRPMGVSTDGKLLKFPNDFFRMQIPASPGLSGAPVIDNENRVIAVVTQGGLWSQSLEMLTRFEQMRDANPPPQQPNTPQGQITVDWISAVGQLAQFFHDWSSPGYGDAVPIGYLKVQPAGSIPRPGKSVH